MTTAMRQTALDRVWPPYGPRLKAALESRPQNLDEGQRSRSVAGQPRDGEFAGSDHRLMTQRRKRRTRCTRRGSEPPPVLGSRSPVKHSTSRRFAPTLRAPHRSAWYTGSDRDGRAWADPPAQVKLRKTNRRSSACTSRAGSWACFFSSATSFGETNTRWGRTNQLMTWSKSPVVSDPS
jgi:hypothetical protein